MFKALVSVPSGSCVDSIHTRTAHILIFINRDGNRGKMKIMSLAQDESGGIIGRLMN